VGGDVPVDPLVSRGDEMILRMAKKLRQREEDW
jgi:hypothetical protein